MGGRVIVVGSVNVELIVSVARLPGGGETVVGGRFARHRGGKGGNQAVDAARLGTMWHSSGPSAGLTAAMRILSDVSVVSLRRPFASDLRPVDLRSVPRERDASSFSG